MRNRFITMVVIGLFVSNPALGVELALSFFQEEYRENVKVSAGERVGAMYEPKKNKVDVNGFHVYAPTHMFTPGEKICLSIRSYDGKYNAFAEVDDVNFEDSRQIKIPSKYVGKLTSYTTDKVVVLASIKKNCRRTTETTKFFPTSWGERKTWDL